MYVCVEARVSALRSHAIYIYLYLQMKLWFRSNGVLADFTGVRPVRFRHTGSGVLVENGDNAFDQERFLFIDKRVLVSIPNWLLPSSRMYSPVLRLAISNTVKRNGG